MKLNMHGNLWCGGCEFEAATFDKQPNIQSKRKKNQIHVVDTFAVWIYSANPTTTTAAAPTEIWIYFVAIVCKFTIDFIFSLQILAISLKEDEYKLKEFHNYLQKYKFDSYKHINLKIQISLCIWINTILCTKKMFAREKKMCTIHSQWWTSLEKFHFTLYCKQ